jgi:ubiquinone/menaquinone biosynthesis C-methylase UbiE
LPSPAAFDASMRLWNRLGLGALRRWTTAPLRGRVLELGCGTGLNLEHYPAAAAVLGLEPDAARLALAVPRAASAAASVTLCAASAESLPFPAASFDAAAGTLVFCTIPDPARALAELRRVLVPGGELRLLEHVRLAHPLVGAFQDAIAPLWYRLAEGCHPNRDTVGTLRAAGFAVEETVPHLGGLVLGIRARAPGAA